MLPLASRAPTKPRPGRQQVASPGPSARLSRPQPRFSVQRSQWPGASRSGAARFSSRSKRQAKAKNFQQSVSKFNQNLKDMKNATPKPANAKENVQEMVGLIGKAVESKEGGRDAFKAAFTESIKGLATDPEFRRLRALAKDSKEAAQMTNDIFQKHMNSMMSSDIVKQLETQLGPELDRMVGLSPDSADLVKSITPDQIQRFQDLVRKEQQKSQSKPVPEAPATPAAPAGPLLFPRAPPAPPKVVTEPPPVTEEELQRFLDLDIAQQQGDRRRQVLASAQDNLKDVLAASQQQDFKLAISRAEDVLKALKELDNMLALPVIFPLMYDALVKDDQLDRATKFIADALKMFQDRLIAADKEHTSLVGEYYTPSGAQEELQVVRTKGSAMKVIAAVAIALQQQQHHHKAADWWRLIYADSPDLSSTYLPLIDSLLHARQTLGKRSKEDTKPGAPLKAEQTKQLHSLSVEIDEVTEEGLKRFPADPEMLSTAARVFIWKGELDKAHELYTKVAKIDLPSGVGYLNRLAMTLISKKEDEKAEVVARQVLSLTQDADKEAHGMLARILKNRNEYLPAIDHMEKAAEGDAKLLTTLGVSLALEPPHPQLKDVSRAKAALGKAVKLAPEHIDAWLTLAAVHAQLREWREAVDTLDKLLQVHPNHSHAVKARIHFASKLLATETPKSL